VPQKSRGKPTAPTSKLTRGAAGAGEGAFAGGAASVGGQGLPLASDSARATPAEPAPAAQAPREP
jgi:hypothetical protein